MTIELLVAILGLAFAYYALLDEDRRSQFAFRMGFPEKVLIGIAFIVPHAFVFDEIYFDLGGPAIFGSFKYGFDEQRVSYLVFLVVALLLCYRLATPRLKAKRLGDFIRYVELLIADERESLAARLVSKYAQSLSMVLRSQKDFLLASVIAYRLGTETFGRAAYREGPKRYEPLIDAMGGFGGRMLGAWLSGIVRANDRSFLRGLRLDRPGPEFELMEFIAEDSKRAEDAALYRPIGETVLNEIARQKREAAAGGSPPLIRHSSEYRGESSIIADLQGGLNAFHMLVSEGAKQNIAWHMWLFYLAHFAEDAVNLAKYCSEDDFEDELGEFFLQSFLSEIVESLTNWIELAKLREVGERHQAPKSWEPTHENDNIPKSAALCLARVFAAIYLCHDMDDGMRKRLLKRSLEQVSRLRMEANWKVLTLKCMLASCARRMKDELLLEDLIQLAEPHIHIELQRDIDSAAK